ncbi:hypothetical protein QAD02_005984 [Eretmocerus hayati]|uniref:Uncharacterized protein n=1 Tax=Eretmocerus hayati TaxID=131215 RepID=A0ACC2MZX1_9HYME|nr:hypothetical protein QAD02_005984 [Eretmocerus hayati]
MKIKKPFTKISFTHRKYETGSLFNIRDLVYLVNSLNPEIRSVHKTKGWNSIRHNLSLHNRFMRVQNEGTGKSSWWMINPDAKPGKSARRRATSMETSKFEKRRGRVKKKVEALRNGLLQADATPSPSSSVSEGLDQFPDSPLHHASSFQLSPDFRPRASSNASSCGRLSPIPAILGEPEWTPNYASTYSPEQLAGSLAETMKLVPGYPVYQNSPSSQQQQQQPQQQQAQQPQQLQQQSQTQTQQQQQQSGPPPPSYYEAQFQRNNALRTSPFGLPPTPQSNPQQRCPVHHIQQCGCQMQSANLVSSMSPPYQQSEPSPASLGSQSVIKQELDDSRPGSPIPSTMMGQLMGALNNTALLDDLNINIEGLSSFGDCDIDEVIKHELQINGTLDINFGQQNSNAGAMTGLGGAGIISGANGGGIPLGGNLPLSDNQLLVNNDQHNNHMHHHSSNAASAAAVFASTNAATPAAAAAATASPSWVH